MGLRYCSYGRYMIVLDTELSELSLRCDGKVIVSQFGFYIAGNKLCLAGIDNKMDVDCDLLIAKYGDADSEKDIYLSVSDNGLKITASEPLVIRGLTAFGADGFAMSTAGCGFFRSAYGTYVSPLDDMIFSRENDSALIVDGTKGRRFVFDRDAGVYAICAEMNGSAMIRMDENVYRGRYNIDYAPINKKATFSKSPVGWMTWYAVKFDASEKTVLDNARYLSENLKKYGAQTIWVDWEWYHKDMKGIRDDGCDTFNPDKEKYPNGLKYVSDEIRRLGLVPSLWIGFTCDPGENEFIKANPDTILVNRPSWCGHDSGQQTVVVRTVLFRLLKSEILKRISA